MIKHLTISDIETIGKYIKDERFDCCEFYDFWTLEELSTWISDSQDITMGYYVDGQLVGFCLTHCNLNISKIYLENIFVSTTYRGKGISKLLLKSVMDEYKKMYPGTTFRYVALVETNNIVAIASLKNTGFNVGDTMFWVQKNK